MKKVQFLKKSVSSCQKQSAKPPGSNSSHRLRFVLEPRFMKKSFVLLLILAFAAGYGLNTLVESIGVEQNKTGGDVSKAKRYNRIRNDEQLNLLQDKLQNDDEYFNQTKEVSSFLLSRVNTLADLTKRSVNQCSGIEELTEQVPGLKSLNLKASNTELALEDIRNGLDRMAQGKDVPDYDQSFNNALAGFFRIENQMDFGKSLSSNTKRNRWEEFEPGGYADCF